MALAIDLPEWDLKGAEVPQNQTESVNIDF